MPKLAVLGQPVAHSRSPAMQTAALRELGLAGEWSYEAIEVSADGFEGLVRGMEAEGFAGANVTVPHKLAALAVADSASAGAEAVGAANTLSLAGGRIEADNTDTTGIVAAMPEPPAGKRALVLGAGGSARAAIWALREGGAEVSLWNRTPARADELAERFGAMVMTPSGPGGTLPLEEFDVLVNTTTVGLNGTAQPGTDLKALRLDVDAITEGHLVMDLVYGAAQTELLAAAQARGATIVDGLEVLVHQGAASLRIWTGAEPPVEVMRAAART